MKIIKSFVLIKNVACRKILNKINVSCRFKIVEKQRDGLQLVTDLEQVSLKKNSCIETDSRYFGQRYKKHQTN